MIPNYPYFGLPNYMRYVNPAYSSYINRTDNTTSKRKIYTGSNKPSDCNVYTGSKKPFERNVYTGTKSTSIHKDKSKENSYKNANFSQDTAPLLSLFGLNLYFDDVLLICIIFFLYNENVNDPFLFITLILLLLN